MNCKYIGKIKSHSHIVNIITCKDDPTPYITVTAAYSQPLPQKNTLSDTRDISSAVNCPEQYFTQRRAAIDDGLLTIRTSNSLGCRAVSPVPGSSSWQQVPPVQLLS